MSKLSQKTTIVAEDKTMSTEMTISHIHVGVSVQFAKTLTIGKRSPLPATNEGESETYSFSIGSEEDLQQAIKEAPFLKDALPLIIDKMSAPYK